MFFLCGSGLKPVFAAVRESSAFLCLCHRLQEQDCPDAEDQVSAED